MASQLADAPETWGNLFSAKSAQVQPIAGRSGLSPGNGVQSVAAAATSQSKRGRNAKASSKGGGRGAVLAAAMPSEGAAWAAQRAHAMVSGAGRSFEMQRQWDLRALQVLEQNLLERVQVGIPLLLCAELGYPASRPEHIPLYPFFAVVHGAYPCLLK
jgi:hypothetical protein